jgi:hypothetical protein
MDEFESLTQELKAKTEGLSRVGSYPKFFKSHILEKMIKPLQKELALKSDLIIEKSDLIIESIFKKIESLKSDELSSLIGNLQSLIILNQEVIEGDKPFALEGINEFFSIYFTTKPLLGDDLNQKNDIIEDEKRSFFNISSVDDMLKGTRDVISESEKNNQSISSEEEKQESIKENIKRSDDQLKKPVADFSKSLNLSEGKIKKIIKGHLNQKMFCPIFRVFQGFILNKSPGTKPIMVSIDENRNESVIMKKGKDGNLLVYLEMPYKIAGGKGESKESLRAVLNYKIDSSNEEMPFKLTDFNLVENFESSTSTNPQEAGRAEDGSDVSSSGSEVSFDGLE